MTRAEPKSSGTSSSPVMREQPSFVPANGQGLFGPTTDSPIFVPPVVQPKLSISQPGDAFEQEADTTADTIMRMATPSASAGSPDGNSDDPATSASFPSVMPKCAACEEEDKEKQPDVQTKEQSALPRLMLKCSHCEAEKHEHEPVQRKPGSNQSDGTGFSLQSYLQRSPAAGEPMDRGTRSFMESRFGADFSSVRIHTDSQAGQASDSIQARAFTHGQNIHFNAGEYQPQTNGGRWLLAHELTHTLQQRPSASGVQRKGPVLKDDDGAGLTFTHIIGTASSDAENLKKIKMLDPGVQRIIILTGNRLDVYDETPKRLKTFTIKDGIALPAFYYFLFNGQFYIVAYNEKNEVVPVGKDTPTTDEQKKKIKELDTLFTIDNWFIKESDKTDFYSTIGQLQTSVISTNLSAKAAGGDNAKKEGPVLSTNYPDWFKELKAKVEGKIAQDRQANKDNALLPDRLFFYSSDKVQLTKGTDAWTIEVEKGKREAYYTILKNQWDEATNKDTFTEQVVAQLYRKVKLMNDETAVQQKEAKEINEIDGTGEKQKGNPWAWAFTLKKQIEWLLVGEKRAAVNLNDFPDKLSLTVQGQGKEAAIYLRVWVYPTVKDAKPADIPELAAGTLPVALKSTDKAADWVPIVRKAAAAIRIGNITTGPSQGNNEDGKANGDATVLPPYPAFIHPVDLNADRTTVTSASNNFRMIVDYAAVHGGPLINLVTINMGMNIGFSWNVFPLPDAIKQLKENTQLTNDQFLEQANTYTKKNRDALGTPKDTYKPDRDWEQSVKMGALGEGDFLLQSRASVTYPPDWNMQRQASVAGFPFSIKKAEVMAAASANSDSDALAELKKQLAAETDERKKEQLKQQIKDLEAREKESDLLTITRKDAAETQKLIKKAGQLKKFIQDDRSRKIGFSGNKDFDPFIFRLKAFDKDLYTLYALVRQVFDFRYDDIYAIDEYTKLIQQQYNELQKLEQRTLRLTTGNDKLNQSLPTYRCVAAIVKEEDGNLVPLTLLIGHHVDSKPSEGKYKLMLIDVTFDSPKKGDMTYAGNEKGSLQEAITSVFTEFGEDNKYGDGTIVYRIPNLGVSGKADSVTTISEYLGYALAAIGIALLVAGAILSAGVLAPAAAAAIGTVVTVLGISAAVAGAVLAARNIYKRVDKGTFELDAEFALDVVSIIGAFVQVVGTAGKAMTSLSRGLGAAQKVVQVQRLTKLLVIYDTVELGGNIVLVGLKVSEDVKAVKDLHLSPDQEEQMMDQIAMEAVQQGAMLAYATFSKVKEVGEHVQTRVAESRYKSFRERNWVDEHGKVTDQAPPFLKNHVAEPGKVPGRAQQGEQAWKETQVLDLAATPTLDKNHKLTLTENGRIIRCSDFCSDLRMKYSETLERDPWMNKEMTDLETRAKQAAKSGNKEEAAKVTTEASQFESKLKEADELRQHLFGMSDKEIDDALKTIDAGVVTGGPKSGHKIDDVRIPKRQRRQIDVSDIMTEAEMKEIGKGGYKKAMDRINAVMGKKISDIDALKGHWEAAKKDVLNGKEITDLGRETAIGKYKDAQRKFWEKVRKDPAAVDFLKKQGFEFEGNSGAPLAVLGPNGKATDPNRGNITNQERRISLDHIDEKAQGDNWKKALNGDNLELMFQNANSMKEIVQVKFRMREETP